MGALYKINDLTTMNKIIFGKLSWLADSIFIFSNILLLSAMLAGSDAIGKTIFTQSNYRFFSVTTAIVGLIICAFQFKKMIKLNSIIVPLLLVMIILPLISCHTLPTAISSPNLTAVVYALLYLLSNIYLVSFIFCKLGASMPQQHTQASFICGALLAIFATIITIVLQCNINYTSSSMPLIALISTLHPKLSLTACVVVWLGILSTTIQIIYTLSPRLKIFHSNTFNNMLICIIGLILSGFGFSFIINYFYPVIGLFGAILVVNIMKKSPK